MHVAFVATPDLSYISGSSLSLRYTVEELAARGVRTTVFCQHAPVAPAVPGVCYRELPMPLDYQVITDQTPTSADLAECLSQLVAAIGREPQVDLVHAIYGTFTGVAAVAAAALLAVPSVISTFGRDILVGAKVDERYRRLMRIAYGAADLVVASDEAVATAVRHEYGAADVCVIPPAVNFAVLRDRPADPPPARPSGRRVVAVQSSFNEQKGLGVLLDAWATVTREVPDARLVVVGHDDTPGARIASKLSEQAARLGITDTLTFAGHQSHQDVIRLLGQCDALVDPRLVNSFSSCVYEAMTAGVPVIASDVACNREALADGRCGVLSAVGDPEDLARALLLVLTDRARADEYRRAGAAHANDAEQTIGTTVVARELHQRYTALTAALIAGPASDPNTVPRPRAAAELEAVSGV